MNLEYVQDPDAQRLAEIAGTLESTYQDLDSRWTGSPFEWILGETSRRRGKIGEQLTEHWCRSQGLSVQTPTDTDCDLLVEGARLEVKFSTLWKNGSFVFQQIRDQEYDLLVCLGIKPFDAHLWAIPKQVLQSEPEAVRPQHGGARGTDTLWLRFNADEPPGWLAQWGGTLEDGTDSLRRCIAQL